MGNHYMKNVKEKDINCSLTSSYNEKLIQCSVKVPQTRAYLKNQIVF